MNDLFEENQAQRHMLYSDEFSRKLAKSYYNFNIYKLGNCCFQW